MREIKFRGRLKQNKKWMYGDLVHVQGEPCLSEDVSAEYKRTIGWNVEPDSMGQFTGLHDKNGKEIYEGDIVKDREFGIVGYIAFHKQSACFRIVFSKSDMALGNRGISGTFLEVIGNIYDNPELLKGDKS